MKYLFKFKLKTTIHFEWYKKFRRKLNSQNLSEEKKTHPEHKYSVTFVSKVGTKLEKDLKSKLKEPPTYLIVNQTVKLKYLSKSFRTSWYLSSSSHHWVLLGKSNWIQRSINKILAQRVAPLKKSDGNRKTHRAGSWLRQSLMRWIYWVDPWLRTNWDSA